LAIFHLDKLANFYLFIGNLVIEDAEDLAGILVSFLDSFVLLGARGELFFKLKYLHFETDDVVILVSYYFLNSSHVDIGFFGKTAGLALIEIP
jgi:hypothetical protein